ncbi:hypothetical protein FOC4_g10008059 [Fusarium odoratissimum]|uniref:Uncharacterized protein n=1 Tax=Fusarium oxysporum f. sp. cubense (strain race 4) TaxID=2502994 RepID=N1RJQ7_FUSC4|nr:hypothetical protein FOC4_g10008059 [Fusarium odoratissimum]
MADTETLARSTAPASKHLLEDDGLHVRDLSIPHRPTILCWHRVLGTTMLGSFTPIGHKHPGRLFLWFNHSHVELDWASGKGRRSGKGGHSFGPLDPVRGCPLSGPWLPERRARGDYPCHSSSLPLFNLTIMLAS